MTVLLRDNWQSKIADIKPRVYPLNYKSQKLIDNTFDELQAKRRLVFTKSHTSFSFSVFVV